MDQGDLWGEAPDSSRELAELAFAAEASDPAAALAIYREAADMGSAWAMEMIGWHYEGGQVVPVDEDAAEDWYHRSICAGSWSATLCQAKLLAQRGDTARCEAILRDGVDSDFVPAIFWLAWYRYRWSPTRATSREIRPLLERAAALGHPMAGKFLWALMVRGRFGIRQLPRGFRLLVDEFRTDGIPRKAGLRGTVG